MTVASPDSRTELTGTVEKRLVGKGSKSEMQAVVLVPDDRAEPDVVLRRRDASALDAEPELLRYVGERVRVVGRRAWATFVVAEIDIIGPDSARNG